MIDHTKLWILIISLGICSFGLRFVFIGLIGDRQMPPWILRHLRYTAVTVLPALVAPLVAWPAATDDHLDPARLIAALAALCIGIIWRNALAAILGGFAALYLLLWLIG